MGGMGVFQRNDAVECEVTVDDGYGVSAPYTTASVVIDNGRPSVAQVAVLATTDEDGDGN